MGRVMRQGLIKQAVDACRGGGQEQFDAAWAMLTEQERRYVEGVIEDDGIVEVNSLGKRSADLTARTWGLGLS